MEADFAERWAAGAVEGWEDRGEGGAAAEGAAGALDLDAFDSADELEMLGGCARLALMDDDDNVVAADVVRCYRPLLCERCCHHATTAAAAAGGQGLTP